MARQLAGKKRIDRTLSSGLGWFSCWGRWCILLNPQEHLKFRGCRMWLGPAAVLALSYGSTSEFVSILKSAGSGPNCLRARGRQRKGGIGTRRCGHWPSATSLGFLEVPPADLFLATPRSQSVLGRL